VVNAVECAVEIQATLKAENASLPPERWMEFRIGVNLGDMVVDGEQIYGDGIKVAARLESLAEPGGIYISGKVREEIRNKLALKCEDLGEQRVKNIAEPVRVFRVLPETGTPSPRTTQRVQRKYVRRGVFLDGVSGNHRRDSRARATCLAQAAAHFRLISACPGPGAPIPRQAIYRVSPR
jgi:hypothetical protein